MRKVLFTACVLMISVGMGWAQTPLTQIYFDNFRVVHAIGSSTMLDDFELGVVNWWDPDGSGSTYGTYYGPGETWNTNSTVFVLDSLTLYDGLYSAKLAYQWEHPESTGFIREYPGAGDPQHLQFGATDKLEVWIYGNASGDLLRFCVDDHGDVSSAHEASVWLPIDWTGWQLVCWDLAVDPVIPWVNGNGILEGPISFDSFQMEHTIQVSVELMLFEAIARDSEVLLEWKTATETNSLGFHIERSLDAATFQRVTEDMIPSAGNSDTEKIYAYVDKGLTNGVTYYYNLISVDMDGMEQVTNDMPAAATPTVQVPKNFVLSQNFPNPFNASTEIRYQIPEAAHLTLQIFNSLGQEVRTLVDTYQEADWYVVIWDGRDEGGREVASGLYMCRLQTGDFSKTIKMALVR